MAQKLPVSEKVGYALGDMAANFVFQFMIALQLDFYTHIFGLSPAQAGTMFCVVGLGVAFLNPVMGVIADRTSSQLGQVPALAPVEALPFGIIGVLTFTTPDMCLGAKLIYAWVTYALAARRLHRQQRALRLADRRDDRRPGRADQHLLVPPDRRQLGGPHHRQPRDPAGRHLSAAATTRAATS